MKEKTDGRWISVFKLLKDFVMRKSIHSSYL